MLSGLWYNGATDQIITLGETIMVRCTCPSLSETIKKGVESMQKEHAPTFVINDYIYGMLHGEWVVCKCEASNEGIAQPARKLYQEKQ